MEDIAEQLAIRDRFMRRQQLQMTPEERIARMQQMQAMAWQTLGNSPRGYAHFMSRNFKKRAIDVTDSNAG